MLAPSIFGREMFDDFFRFPFFDDSAFKKTEKNLMRTDVRETDNAYELEMELPGFRKEDVQVSLEDGYLTVQAAQERTEEKKEEKTGAYIRRERYAGSYQRTFYVGKDVTQEEIKGEFRQGILHLTVPKKEEQPEVEKKKYIAIEG